jgi:hypothetical protein
MPRFAVLCLALAGCELAFPIVLETDAEEAETKDASMDAAADSGERLEDHQDGAVWDHKGGS